LGVQLLAWLLGRAGARSRSWEFEKGVGDERLKGRDWIGEGKEGFIDRGMLGVD
jgi:hypothetical protein